TFEILPPLKGGSFVEIAQTIEPLLEFSPSYINVTSHRDETSYRTNAQGDVERFKTKKRPGSVGVAAAIKFKYKVPVVTHVLCAGFTRDETEDALIDLHFLEMHNLLVLRGDKMKTDPAFIPETGGHAHAVDLLRQIGNMNKGIYLNSEIENAMPTHFSCGVAGYPEMHADAKSAEQDLLYIKDKVDAGGEYIVTQMFFDNAKYFDFVQRCRQIGITVPIVPGLKPIAAKNQVNVLPELFSIVLPDALEKELRKCKTNEEAKIVGTEWLIMQAKELRQRDVPAIHVYTFGIPDNVYKMCKEVF
ncbi:MAG: methylenetetrahydrofolate reductase, partial [Bacteroidales bacterium]|nr:methylenetetrahydrofolate reductase [Bacteroidales bacterium]